MERNFSQALSELRKNKGYSQRKVAADLKISQALLSHYENGAREPGLSFVCRACDYYNVSADYILGRADDPCNGTVDFSTFLEISSELKQLSKKAELALMELSK